MVFLTTDQNSFNNIIMDFFFLLKTWTFRNDREQTHSIFARLLHWGDVTRSALSAFWGSTPCTFLASHSFFETCVSPCLVGLEPTSTHHIFVYYWSFLIIINVSNLIGVTAKARWCNFIFMLFPDFNYWECNSKIFQVVFLLMGLEILLVFFLYDIWANVSESSKFIIKWSNDFDPLQDGRDNV